MNNLKPVQPVVITDLLKNGMFALQEPKNFFFTLENRNGPHQSQILPRNMLRTRILHEELNENQCNENYVVLSVMKAYQGVSRLTRRAPDLPGAGNEDHGSNIRDHRMFSKASRDDVCNDGAGAARSLKKKVAEKQGLNYKEQNPSRTVKLSS